jgi:hypothetical protein
MEAMVQRLYGLTQDGARITTAQIPEVLHSLVQNMDGEQIRQACRAGVVEHPSF